MTEITNTLLGGTSVVVTGGARGLGLEMTKALVAAGASVLVVDIDQDPIDEVINTMTGAVHGLRADVSSETEVSQIVGEATRLFGHLDVVINNAGINLLTIDRGDSPTTPCAFYELDPLTVQRFFEVHVMGPFLLSRAAVGQMIEQGFGRIVTVTTSLDTMIREKGAPYGPMKAASEAFTATMARDLQHTAVTANILVPGGPVLTRFVGDASTRPPGSLLEAPIMGPPAVWLASHDSDGVNAMRFIASKWDPSLPSDEAAGHAGAPIAWPSGHLSRI